MIEISKTNFQNRHSAECNQIASSITANGKCLVVEHCTMHGEKVHRSTESLKSDIKRPSMLLARLGHDSQPPESEPFPAANPSLEPPHWQHLQKRLLAMCPDDSRV